MAMQRFDRIRRSAIVLIFCGWTFAAAQAPAPADPPAAPPEAPGSPVATPPAPPKPKRVDINAARLETLMTLPGVSERTAQAIIAGRPYHSPVDLKTRNIIPIKTYDAILDRIVAKSQRLKAK